MEPFDRFAQALALTESDNRETAWGDGGGDATAEQRGRANYLRTVRDRAGALGIKTAILDAILDELPRGVHFLAAGRWQMHPAFYADWRPQSVGVLDSWDTVFRHALANFWVHRIDYHGDPHKAAMEFHLGVEAVAEGKWATAYAMDFKRHWDALGDEPKSQTTVA